MQSFVTSFCDEDVWFSYGFKSVDERVKVCAKFYTDINKHDSYLNIYLKFVRKWK